MPSEEGSAAANNKIGNLPLLFEIARTFDKHVELRGALSPVLNLLHLRAGLLRAMVTLLDRASGLLKIEEAEGLSPEEKARALYHLGEGLVGRVFESGNPLVVRDLAKESRFLNRAKNRTKKDMAGVAFICVPVRENGASGRVSGTLSAERRLVGNADTDEILKSDKALLEEVAAIISDSAKLREHLLQKKIDDTDIPQECRTPLAPESGIIGASSALRAVYEMAEQVAPSDATVLITGESGTGKELLAREIVRLSRRKNAPFVTVNCAALPESIIESELFGHEKGAFTGAASLRKGRFELADRGTIFLDEIGELSSQVQVKLLRVLQEREIERVGGDSVLKIDARLIAATNKNLETEVAAGRFRADLFYRLNVFPLHMPPLRERKSDIMLLADYFTEKYAAKNGKAVARISTPAIDLLTAYHWPGNVRELENCIERAVILSRDRVIHAYNLPPSLQSSASTGTETAATLPAALARLEKEMIVEALKTTEGNSAEAARRLGVTERQMGLRLRHYGINAKFYRHVPR